MDYTRWTSLVSQSLAQLVQSATAYLPNILGAGVLVLLGWLLAKALRAASSRLLTSAMARFASNASVRSALERTGLQRTIPQIISGLAFWFVLLFFVTAAVEQLQITIVTRLLSDFAVYLPNVFVAVLIVFAGLVGGNLAHHSISRSALSAGLRQGELLGRLAQVTVVLLSIVMAADQVGIQSTFIMLTVVIVFGTSLGGAALAFGLGSGATVSNIIASYYLHQTYRVGHVVRIGEAQGTILKMTATGVVLETKEGRVLVPAKKFSEDTSLLLTGE